MWEEKKTCEIISPMRKKNNSRTVYHKKKILTSCISLMWIRKEIVDLYGSNTYVFSYFYWIGFISFREYIIFRKNSNKKNICFQQSIIQYSYFYLCHIYYRSEGWWITCLSHSYSYIEKKSSTIIYLNVHLTNRMIVDMK
jgi:hypothetical protein